jgi:hypothetical protein
MARRDDGHRLDDDRLRGLLAPAGWVIFWPGVILEFCAPAILRFDVISGAPAEEPISGLLHRWPIVENSFFAFLLYGAAALGCLAFPFATKPGSLRAWGLVYWS